MDPLRLDNEQRVNHLTSLMSKATYFLMTKNAIRLDKEASKGERIYFDVGKPGKPESNVWINKNTTAYSCTCKKVSSIEYLPCAHVIAVMMKLREILPTKEYIKKLKM